MWDWNWNLGKKTAFIAAAAGVKRQGDTQNMAPLSSKLLGQGFNSLDGKLIGGILREGK